jgi:gentisate 1,2-dioxygenase
MDSPAQTLAKAKPGKTKVKAKNDNKNGKASARDAYYERLSKHDMAPLWVVLKDIIPDEPKTVCAPAIWHFKDVKPIVLEAGEMITAKEATRRVLVLENPTLRGQSRITQSLYAGLQLIMPGEIAPVHRHSPSAIRFILDGEGAYTQVEGEKTIMSPGDFVLTPNWAAHDHGNTSKQPMIWLDVLDVPTINFFETCFYQHYETEKQNTRLDHEDSLARYGSGVLPDGADVTMNRSPIVNYPYSRMRPILDRLARSGDIDPRHGARFRYANPLTGGWSMPTMGAHLALLPKNFKGKDYRATDSTIFVCVEGKGTTKVGGKTLEWGPRDVFVVPSWQKYSHTAAQESVLFSISDRPAQEALGIWRENN